MLGDLAENEHRRVLAGQLTVLSGLPQDEWPELVRATQRVPVRDLRLFVWLLTIQAQQPGGGPLAVTENARLFVAATEDDARLQRWRAEVAQPNTVRVWERFSAALAEHRALPEDMQDRAVVWLEQRVAAGGVPDGDGAAAFLVAWGGMTGAERAALDRAVAERARMGRVALRRAGMGHRFLLEPPSVLSQEWAYEAEPDPAAHPATLGEAERRAARMHDRYIVGELFAGAELDPLAADRALRYVHGLAPADARRLLFTARHLMIEDERARLLQRIVAPDALDDGGAALSDAWQRVFLDHDATDNDRYLELDAALDPHVGGLLSEKLYHAWHAVYDEADEGQVHALMHMEPAEVAAFVRARARDQPREWWAAALRRLDDRSPPASSGRTSPVGSDDLRRATPDPHSPRKAPDPDMDMDADWDEGAGQDPVGGGQAPPDTGFDRSGNGRLRTARPDLVPAVPAAQATTRAYIQEARAIHQEWPNPVPGARATVRSLHSVTGAWSGSAPGRGRELARWAPHGRHQ